MVESCALDADFVAINGDFGSFLEALVFTIVAHRAFKFATDLRIYGVRD